MNSRKSLVMKPVTKYMIRDVPWEYEMGRTATRQDLIYRNVPSVT